MRSGPPGALLVQLGEHPLGEFVGAGREAATVAGLTRAVADGAGDGGEFFGGDVGSPLLVEIDDRRRTLRWRLSVVASSIIVARSALVGVRPWMVRHSAFEGFVGGQHCGAPGRERVDQAGGDAGDFTHRDPPIRRHP